jgi:S-adenosylmethionine:tRNA ribosyltransferase-isomerase
MYPEYYEISDEVSASLNESKKNGGRIICIGTTTVRALETSSTVMGEILSGTGWTEKYIYPGYHFRVVDGLLSNLQPPRATNLILQSAFVGHELLMNAYRQMASTGYRFLEFGDCLFAT